MLDDIVIFTGGKKHDGMNEDQIYDHDLHPLFHVQAILCMNHFLQIVFLRHFYDRTGLINKSHSWVWIVHSITYPYAIYTYFFTDMYESETSQTTKIWIPLDVIVTISIVLYYFIYLHI